MLLLLLGGVFLLLSLGAAYKVGQNFTQKPKFYKFYSKTQILEMYFTGEAGEELCDSERTMIERGLECV